MEKQIKCPECECMECANVSYKSYYCTAGEEIIHLGVDYPPKRPPKSCPKKENANRS